MIVVNEIIKNSEWEVWNIGEHNRENTNKCLVPFVRCDENLHVIETVYLKVDSVEDAEALMNAAHLGYRRNWHRVRQARRKVLAQKGLAVLEKYLA